MAHAEGGPPPGRPRILRGVATSIPLPAYIPSFSETHIGDRPIRLDWDTIHSALRRARPKAVMLTAFDFMYGPNISPLAGKAIATQRHILDVIGLPQSTFLFLDSGGLELGDNPGTEFTPEMSFALQSKFNGDVITLFDHPGNPSLQSTSGEADHAIAMRFSNAYRGPGTLASVVHGASESDLIEGAKRMAELPNVGVICVPKKELHGSIDQVCSTVAQLRSVIGDRVLHILGQGSPRAWVYLVQAGADSFDATTWCRNVLLPGSFHQQAGWTAPRVRCSCGHCRGASMVESCQTRTDMLIHNITLLLEEMERIRETRTTAED